MAKTSGAGSAGSFGKANQAASKLNSTLADHKDLIGETSAAVGGLFNKVESVLRTVGSAYKSGLMEPIKAISDSLESLAGINLSNLMSYGGQLSTIADTTKTIVHEQIAWEQQLIGIYKQVAEVARGSSEIFNMVVKTRKDTSKNILEWMKWGGVAEGVKLATLFAQDSVAEIGKLSNDILMNWKEQNLALGITDESSAKIAAYHSRSNMSLEESLSNQVAIFATLKKQFKSNALTSKMMEDIAGSNFAILSYTKGSVQETARVAGHAHAWKVEIDEIYQTAQALSEAEKSIELARKAQLMFGIKMNARQMQYMAQTGKEVDLTAQLVDSFRENVGSFDDLTLSQRQFIADTIASGDLIKARTMILGREKELTEGLTDTNLTQLDVLKEQNVLLEAQTDYLAAYQLKYARERRMLWDTWGDQLTFIFGKSKEQMNVEEMSLALEKTRVQILAQSFVPLLEKLNMSFQNINGINSLIGDGMLDQTSVLGHMYENLLKPISEIAGYIGGKIFEWWFGGEKTIGAFERIRGILDYLNTPAVLDKIVGALTWVGDHVIGVIENVTSNKDMLDSWINGFANIGKALVVVVKAMGWMINNWETVIRVMSSIAFMKIAMQAALINPWAGLAILAAGEISTRIMIHKIKKAAATDKIKAQNDQTAREIANLENSVKNQNTELKLDKDTQEGIGKAVAQSLTTPVRKGRKPDKAIAVWNLGLEA